LAPGLPPEDLLAIQELAAACTRADGGRLKLEETTLRSRPPDALNDFLWFDEQGLAGFLGLYGHTLDQAELCGMVRPSARRQGIFSRLFEAAMAEVASRGVPGALLVVDRAYETGARFARSVGGIIEHSEHRMTLRREPAPVTPDPLITLRGAEPSDTPFMIRCLGEAFGLNIAKIESEDLDVLTSRLAGSLVICREDEPVGTIRIERDGDEAGIYGFVVSPQFQGGGIGRQVLWAVIKDLTEEGVSKISLEVDSTNDAALHLYLSSGFDVLGTEDYYAVAVGAAPAS